MDFTGIIQGYIADPTLRDLGQQLSEAEVKFHIKDLVGSAASFAAMSVFRNSELPQLIILNDKEEAAYFLNDLEGMLGDKDVLFYPGSYRRPYQIEETDNANVRLRAEVLNKINTSKKPKLIVTYPDALFEKVITKKELSKNTLQVRVGDELSIDFLNETLFEYHFERVDFVTEPGQFSIRGGIVDVYSFSNENPYRIEFFGDDVESIRTFDIENQLSIKMMKRLAIVPNVERKVAHESREFFLRYLPQNTVVWVKSIPLCGDRLNDQFEKAQQSFEKLSEEIKHSSPEALFVDGKTLESEIHNFRLVEFGSNPYFQNAQQLKFDTIPQPSFNKQFDLLGENLNSYTSKGYENTILCSNPKQVERFYAIFEDINAEVKFHPIVANIHQGFVDHDRKIVCYTDHQIFERYQKFRLKTGYEKKEAINLGELNQLQPGDYVTHIDHGIGRFGGLKKIDVNGKPQEAIKLVYDGNDILYISIHSLHKISKYSGKEGKEPRINKLGSNTWAKLKQKTKKRVKEIAYDLIQLYAKRKTAKGFAFSPDTYLQHELEASFIYEDTPDQVKATEAVKLDMESEMPMDRLVCGDVGFGKTEIAIRAAFKAVADSKQVAILVPTTILAMQHAKTFRKRLEGLPCSIDYINRFKTKKQQDETLKNLAEGKVDIIIGTHRLVGKDVKFKDLGLLIIDEEQKFGVAVKDKLKTFKINIDTLTLSATPIPRTLQFSLMAARDLSVMNTPPPNRYPVETEIIPFNEEIIRDAISYEVQRGGQVYFINNRIENILEVAGMIQRLLPDVKVGIGHGQMEGKKLESIMLDFMDGDFDVLVATSIIESGLDISNANTIFINNAHHFGLSDLHQMRGRVGRSNKKAFAYMICPPLNSLTSEARKRMNALEQFSGLGSGFNIAMRDLEIRGAGDLLGGEQSGFISDLGFDAYQKILAEAVDELKENEFKDLYAQTNKGQKREFVRESQLDTDLEILIPDQYVNTVTERLKLYQELNDIKDEVSLQIFEEALHDRFGPIPEVVSELLDSVRLRWIAKDLGFEKLILKKEKLIGYFVSNPQSDFYQSPIFGQFLEFLKHNHQYCEMKEKNGKLNFVYDKVKSVREAIDILQPILEIRVG